MKVIASHRFENRHYLVSDREINRFYQLISFYHTSWSNIPDFEKMRVEDLDTHEYTEIPVRELIFEKKEEK